MSEPIPALTKARPAWARFTILDLGFLIAGLALGFAVTRGAGSSASYITNLALGTLVGLALSAPVVLLRQYEWGGRAGELGPGEWVWLSEAGYWLLSLILFLVPWEYLGPALIWVAVILVFGGLFFHPMMMVLSLDQLARLAGRRPRAQSHWSELFGLVYGAFIGPICLGIILVAIVQHLL